MRRQTLEGVVAGRSGISVPTSLALHLDPGLATGPIEAFLVGTEFAHLHGDGSGSLHLALPLPDVEQVLDNGWGEQHPVVAMGYGPHTWVMLYGPRDEHEAEVVRSLLRTSYAFARGTLPAGGGAAF